MVANLRNRPPSDAGLDSTRDTVVSPCNDLVAGSGDFPPIPFGGSLSRRRVFTPFAEQEQGENTWQPCPETAPGPTHPRVDPLPPIVLTPVLPERVEPGALPRDSGNRVQRPEANGRRVSGVISTVFRTNPARLTDRRRVSDYAEDGQCLASVLCGLAPWSVRSVPKSRKRRRDRTEEEGSRSQPKKRLRP